MSETRKTVLCMKTHIKPEGTAVPQSQASGTQQLPRGQAFPMGFSQH